MKNKSFKIKLFWNSLFAAIGLTVFFNYCWANISDSDNEIRLIPGVSSYEDVIRLLGNPEGVETNKKKFSDVDIAEDLILLYPSRGIDVGFDEKEIEKNPKVNSIGYRSPFAGTAPANLRVGMDKTEAIRLVSKNYNEVLTMENRMVFKRDFPKKEELFLIFSNDQLAWIKHFKKSGLLPALYLMKLGVNKEEIDRHSANDETTTDFFFAGNQGFARLVLYSFTRVFSPKLWLIFFGLLSIPAFMAIMLSLFDSSMISPEITLWVQRISSFILYTWSVLFIHHYTEKSILLLLIPAGIFFFILLNSLSRFQKIYRKNFGKPESSREWICKNCGAVNDIIIAECPDCGTRNN